MIAEQRSGRAGGPRPLALLHRTVKKVTADLETLSFNTAIAAPIHVNEITKLELDPEDLKALALLCAPFVPHSARRSGGSGRDREHLLEPGELRRGALPAETVNLVVQVNGKKRGTREVRAGVAEAACARRSARGGEWLGRGKQVVKEILRRQKQPREPGREVSAREEATGGGVATGRCRPAAVAQRARNSDLRQELLRLLLRLSEDAGPRPEAACPPLPRGLRGLCAYFGAEIESVLEVGAGVGPWRDRFRRYRPSVRYRSTDASAYACERFGHERRDISRWRARGRFDLIVCQGVLPYLDDEACASAALNLAAMARGFLYLEAPTRRDFREVCDDELSDLTMRARPGEF